MKRIKAFRQEPYGLFIDLDDAPASLGINPNTGEVLLNEGVGPDRFEGAAISLRSSPHFELKSVGEHQWDVTLSFGNGRCHSLGTTGEYKAAQTWIAEAERTLEAAARRGCAAGSLTAT